MQVTVDELRECDNFFFNYSYEVISSTYNVYIYLFYVCMYTYDELSLPGRCYMGYRRNMEGFSLE